MARIRGIGQVNAKMARDAGRGRREFKRDRAAQRADRCEVCDWRPPALPGWMERIKRGTQFLHAHHIIPTAYRGSDAADNLILLCQNHHAIAHACQACWLIAGRFVCSRALLVSALQCADRFPDDWFDRFNFRTGRVGNRRTLRHLTYLGAMGFDTRRRKRITLED